MKRKEEQKQGTSSKGKVMEKGRGGRRQTFRWRVVTLKDEERRGREKKGEGSGSLAKVTSNEKAKIRVMRRCREDDEKPVD
jgi:hypothetical protein